MIIKNYYLVCAFYNFAATPYVRHSVNEIVQAIKIFTFDTQRTITLIDYHIDMIQLLINEIFFQHQLIDFISYFFCSFIMMLFVFFV